MLNRQLSNRASGWRNVIRIIAAMLGILACGWLTVDAAGRGISRLLSDYGLRANLPIVADRAVSYRADDPETRFYRAQVFAGSGDPAAAAQELERAVSLRPRDHTLWVELGLARDQAGDADGSIAAFQQATRLAPYYAQPRWQLGNALIRVGRYDEAFIELRGAVASDPALLPNTIDLAYGLYAGDAAAVERAIQPQTPSARFTLARFFARNEKPDDALRLFHASGRVSEADRQKLLSELFAAKQFPAAYEVWTSGLDEAHRTIIGSKGPLIDGSFEDEVRTAAITTFGWRIDRDQRAVKTSLNTREPHSGARSLLVEWNGDPQPSTAVASQVVLVAPGKVYRVSFWVRTEELVTAGSPIITVTDAGKTERLLTYSASLKQTSNEWRQYSLQFETNADTQAVNIAVRREGCVATPCPIFGRIWFDDFALGNP
ncbi:MAG: tetratricopeptide repeat protein [Acidobacteria bacterium]|nr:tetratricopeptide repeat protein [Acidobacteriota bacterium]